MVITQGIKLDETTRGRLKDLAAKRDRTPHYLMKAAIERYLDAEERYEREKAEDMAEYEDYQLTGKAVENEKVVAWLEDLANGKQRPCPR
jgi:predicted transcriptional regulator